MSPVRPFYPVRENINEVNGRMSCRFEGGLMLLLFIAGSFLKNIEV